MNIFPSLKFLVLVCAICAVSTRLHADVLCAPKTMKVNTRGQITLGSRMITRATCLKTEVAVLDTAKLAVVGAQGPKGDTGERGPAGEGRILARKSARSEPCLSGYVAVDRSSGCESAPSYVTFPVGRSCRRIRLQMNAVGPYSFTRVVTYQLQRRSRPESWTWSADYDTNADSLASCSLSQDTPECVREVSREGGVLSYDDLLTFKVSSDTSADFPWVYSIIECFED
jgi:hypothetical protein